ncbi:MAG: hypothetical protein K6G40_05805 [Eubacterium sp.]|nr:hypothetical protein [Eubacterium sp.]
MKIYRLVAAAFIFALLTIQTVNVDAATGWAFVEVESYEILEGALEPGNNVTLKLNLHNTSINTAVYGVMITVASADGYLKTAYGSDNQVYVGNLAASANIETEITLTVSDDFDAEAATLNITADYMYSNAAQQNNCYISIPAYVSEGIVSLETNVSSTAYVGFKSYLSLGYSNESLSAVDDIKLIVDGNVSDNTKEFTLDSINSGQVKYDDFYVVFTEEGEQEITLSFSYEDEDGNKVVTKIGTYTVNVLPADEESGGGFEFSKYGAYFVCGLAVIAAVVSCIIYYRKRL